MTPYTSHGHAPAQTRVDPSALRERDAQRANEAARLITAALTKAFKGTKVKLSGECEVEEIDELGQVHMSFPTMTIVTSLSHPTLMAQWSLQELEVETTGLSDRVEQS